MKSWYRNHLEHDEEDPGKWDRHWCPRSVVTEIYKDRIQAEVASRSGGAAAGTTENLRHWSRSITKVRDTLTENEEMEVMRLAEEWNTEGPPEDIKRR